MPNVIRALTRIQDQDDFTGSLTTNQALTWNGSAFTLAAVSNSMLTNSSITIGTTAISLGSSSTTLAGLTSVTNALLIGGTTTTSTLTLQSTSGAGTTGADILFKTGNNGATEVCRITNVGNILFGTTTTPASATYNLVLGGGTPILGAATADMVTLAAVDDYAGDRRLHIQAEQGSAISIGNDRIDLFGATGYLSSGGIDILAITTGSAYTTKLFGIGASPSYPLDITNTSTNSTKYIQRLAAITSCTTSGTYNVTGIISDMTSMSVTAGQTDSGSRIGVAGHAYSSVIGMAGTLTSQYGLIGRAGLVTAASTAIVTNAYAVYAEIFNNVPSSTIANAYGLYVSNIGTNGTITNRWGVYVDTNVATGKNYFSNTILIGTTTVPTSATVNLVLGGGSNSPVLGAATADIVSIAAVDDSAGDRRFHVQAELGSPISLGNNRLDFAATTGYITIAGTSVISSTATTLSLPLLTSNGFVKTSGGTGALSVSSTVADGDIASALTGKTYNGLTISSTTGTFTLTNAKVFSVSNTLTIAGTDGSTLNVGAGGTLGTGAFQPQTVLTGTSNQVTVSNGGVGATTLSLPQSIATSSTPQFAGLGLGVAAASTGLKSLSTTTQITSLYDASNYMTITTASVGSTTFALTGTSPTFTFSQPVLVTIPGDANDASTLDFRIISGADGVLGPMQLNFGCHPSATAGSRYAYFYSGDSSTTRPIAINSNGASSFGDVGMGTVSPSARLHIIKTTEQLRLGYDASNYLSITTGSAGSTTLALTGTSPTFTFSQATTFSSDLTINGNTTVGNTGTDTVTFNAAAWTFPAATTHTITKTSTASTAEVILKCTVSDDTSSYFQVLNGSATDAIFTPTFEGVQSATGSALSFFGTGTTDSGTSPLVLFLCRISGGVDIATRPMFEFRNRATTVLKCTGGNNWQFTGSATSPTLASTAADSVFVAAVDAAAGDRRLYIQPEAGSAMSFGNDRVNFAATTGIVSIGGTDVLGIKATSLTVGHQSTALGRLEARATSGAQIVSSYDASNYMSITTGSAGSTTLDLTGTTPTFSFSDAVTITSSSGSTLPLTLVAASGQTGNLFKVQSNGGTSLATIDFAGTLTLATALSIANGGTGQITAGPAFDALTVKGADIASASTTNLATATGSYVNVTGTTTITALGTAAAGVQRIVNFNGALTLTHNATSLILPGAANITTSAGDTAEFISLGSGNWVCIGYTHAVTPWNGQWVLLATSTASSVANVSFSFLGWTNSDYIAYRLVITNVKPATNNVQAYIRTSADGSAYDSGAGSYSYCNMENSVGSFSTSATQIPIGGASATTIGNGTNFSSSGFVDIYNPSAALYCKITSSFSATCSDTYPRINMTAGQRMSAAAVKGIQFLFSSGNIASGDFRLYGIRGTN